MNLQSHLDELRRRILLVIVPLTLLTGGMYTAAGKAVSVILAEASGLSLALNVYGIADGFILRLKFSFLLAIFLLMPWILFQIAMFVLPGLLRREKPFFIALVVLSGFIISACVFLCYDFLIKSVVALFLSVSPDSFGSAISAVKLLDFSFMCFCVLAFILIGTVCLALFAMYSFFSGKED